MSSLYEVFGIVVLSVQSTDGGSNVDVRVMSRYKLRNMGDDVE